MPAADPTEDRQAISALRGGSETILLVEDEQSLRVLTRNVLTQLGYRVLESIPYPVGTDVSITLVKDLSIAAKASRGTCAPPSG